MRISSLSESVNIELRKTEASKRNEKLDKQRPVSQVDKSSFSASGQRLSETKANTELVAAQIASQPDIRPERIADVQSKIESGFYNTPEFADKLADKLIQDFGLSSGK